MSATLNSTATVKLVTDITQMRQRLAELGRIQRKLTDDERRERRNLANEVKALDREVIRNRAALRRAEFQEEQRQLRQQRQTGLSATGQVGAGNLAQGGGAVLGKGDLKTIGSFYAIQKAMQGFGKLMDSLDKAAKAQTGTNLSEQIDKVFNSVSSWAIRTGGLQLEDVGLKDPNIRLTQEDSARQMKAMRLAQARAAAEARRRENMDNARFASADAYENAVHSGTPAQRARARAAAMRAVDQRRREIERSNTFTASVANVGQSYNINAKGIGAVVDELRKLNCFAMKNGINFFKTT